MKKVLTVKELMMFCKMQAETFGENSPVTILDVKNNIRITAEKAVDSVTTDGLYIIYNTEK